MDTVVASSCVCPFLKAIPTALPPTLRQGARRATLAVETHARPKLAGQRPRRSQQAVQDLANGGGREGGRALDSDSGERQELRVHHGPRVGRASASNVFLSSLERSGFILLFFVFRAPCAGEVEALWPPGCNAFSTLVRGADGPRPGHSRCARLRLSCLRTCPECAAAAAYLPHVSIAFFRARMALSRLPWSNSTRSTSGGASASAPSN